MKLYCYSEHSNWSGSVADKKFGLLLFVLCLIQGLLAQPTGHQKLYLLITDQGKEIHFKEAFSKRKIERLNAIVYGAYQLTDISNQPSGFTLYAQVEYFHKTIYNKQHRLLITRNKLDSMVIEIDNLFDVSFLHVPFTKGKFKLLIGDRKNVKWDPGVSPLRSVKGEQIVYDISPSQWMLPDSFGKPVKPVQYLSVLKGQDFVHSFVVIPENDSAFRRMKHKRPIKTELGDFNLDGIQDYRVMVDSSQNKWDYFIYDSITHSHKKDSVMSSLNMIYNQAKNTYQGYLSTRVNELTNQTDIYDLINGKMQWTGRSVCVQFHRYAERIDCSYYDVINGELILKSFIRGAE